MSTLARFADSGAVGLFDRVLDAVDERMRDCVHADFEAARTSCEDPLDLSAQIVLVGHRAAGKSRVLPLIAEAVNREAVDLDRHIERIHGRPLREWVTSDVASFRAAERNTFAGLPRARVIAVGGGFWSNHADLLSGRLVVEIPVSFRTYRERLLSDQSRPRLRPELPVDEEIRLLYRAREFAHRASPHTSLGRLLAAVLPSPLPERC